MAAADWLGLPVLHNERALPVLKAHPAWRVRQAMPLFLLEEIVLKALLVVPSRVKAPGGLMSSMAKKTPNQKTHQPLCWELKV